MQFLSFKMSEPTNLPTVQLNTRGLRCPEPVMMLHQAIRKAKSGDTVEVWAADNSTTGTFQNFVCIWDMSWSYKKKYWMMRAIKSFII